MKYYRGIVSATSQKEAKQLLSELARKNLVAGGLITEGLSTYWWEGELKERTYFNISIFTQSSKTEAIKKAVCDLHSDEVPIISFFEIVDANDHFLQWILESTTQNKT